MAPLGSLGVVVCRGGFALVALILLGCLRGKQSGVVVCRERLCGWCLAEIWELGVGIGIVWEADRVARIAGMIMMMMIQTLGCAFDAFL